MTERSSTSAHRSPARRMKAATRRVRELASIAHALASTGHPYMAHIVPMRRCNLSCTYCNEFDDVSDPVPLTEMLRRIDDLARLGTSSSPSPVVSRCCILNWNRSSPASAIMAASLA